MGFRIFNGGTSVMILDKKMNNFIFLLGNDDK